MKRDDDNMFGILMGALVIILLCVAGDVWWADYVYGDWTCAFSRCVRMTTILGNDR